MAARVNPFRIPAWWSQHSYSMHVYVFPYFSFVSLARLKRENTKIYKKDYRLPDTGRERSR